MRKDLLDLNIVLRRKGIGETFILGEKHLKIDIGGVRVPLSPLVPTPLFSSVIDLSGTRIIHWLLVKEVSGSLFFLPSQVTFVFFICNALWLAATFFLQEISSVVSIKVPKIFLNGSLAPQEYILIDPIGFMFLLSFASLIVIQFLAMLWHR